MQKSKQIIKPTAVDLPPEVLKVNLEKNISILENHFNGNPEGMLVTFEALDELGFDFKSNNGQGILYNTPNPDDCNFVVYGQFHLYRITFETVLIVNPQISLSC